MKCTNNTRLLRRCGLLFVLAFLCLSCACGKTSKISDRDEPYPMYQPDRLPSGAAGGKSGFFGEDLCRTLDINHGTDEVKSECAQSAGVFNLDTQEVRYSQNMFQQLYPASTTKIMTAYLVLRNADLNRIVTVSAKALDIGSKSSNCGLKEGDTISMRDLLYGMMLASGNDAANVLAENCAGSIEEFVEQMNAEAKRIGATGTHFANANGLADETHYTTVYDMYLIMTEALKTDGFIELISAKNREVAYTTAAGKAKTVNWKNNNQFMTGDYKLPGGFTLVGGKTGNTGSAGYCLVLFTRNERDERIISIVFKVDTKSNMYTFTSQILERFAN